MSITIPKLRLGSTTDKPLPSTAKTSTPVTMGISIPGVSSLPEINTSNLPANPVDNSDIMAQAMGQVASLQEQIKSISDAIAKLQQPKATETTGTTQPTEQKQGIGDLLKGIMGQREELRAGQPNMAEQYKTAITDTLAQYGLTPESYQTYKTTQQKYIGQIAAYQQQIIDLENQKQTKLGIAEQRGMDMTYIKGEKALIERQYNSKIAGVSAQAGIVTQQMTAEQALRADDRQAFQDAMTLTDKIVDLQVYDQKQKLDDLDWIKDTYTDIFNIMSKEEQRQWDNAYKLTKDEYDNAWEQYKFEIETQLKERGLDIEAYKATGVGEGIISGQGALGEAFNKALTGTTTSAADRKYMTQIFNDMVSKGQTNEAREFVADMAMQGMGTTLYQNYVNRKSTIDEMGNIKGLLTEYYAARGSTNIFSGAYEKVLNKLGTTRDAKLAGIENRIKEALTRFTVAVSGVQFSDRERAQYEAMFPSTIWKTKKLNIVKLDSLMAAMNAEQKSVLSQKLGGDTYNKLFGSSGGTGGTTVMTGPDGKQWNVPNNQVELFKQNGYK